METIEYFMKCLKCIDNRNFKETPILNNNTTVAVVYADLVM